MGRPMQARCRTKGCDNPVDDNSRGKKDGLCWECFEELQCLREMRARKKKKPRRKRKWFWDDDDDGGGPMDGLPAYA
jgi:hypothetical protein